LTFVLWRTNLINPFPSFGVTITPSVYCTLIADDMRGGQRLKHEATGDGGWSVRIIFDRAQKGGIQFGLRQ
jgi:hypothetical protein